MSAMLFRSNSGQFEARSTDVTKNQKSVAGTMIGDSCELAGNLIMMMELRKKILTFRDIIDFPPCDEAGPINELVIETIRNLHKVYPNVVPHTLILEMKEVSMYKGLGHLYNALNFVGDSWAKNHKWIANFECNEEGSLENINSEQLGGRVLAKLDHMIMIAREMFDVMDEDERNSERRAEDSSFGDVFTESYSGNKVTYPSPDTPTSVPPEIRLSITYFPPVLLPLRLQAVGKLKSLDMKCLSFPNFSQVSTQGSSLTKEKNDKMNASEEENQQPKNIVSKALKYSEALNTMPKISNVNSNMMSEAKEQAAPPPLPTLLPSNLPPTTSVAISSPNFKPNMMPDVEVQAVAPPLPPPLPSNLPQTVLAAAPSPPSKLPLKVTTAPPPPPILPLKGSVPPQLPPMPITKGAAPPPPPPGAVAKALRPRKANTKLRRSTHMGNLYRVLKRKLEGSSLQGKNSHGKKSSVGESAGGKQGMADALAEMTKRSAYFQQIEEDVQKHGKVIMEMKVAICSFQTKDMDELLKFHKYVEQHLEELTDETQVLARFEDFPTKKLETLRMAAALYLKLKGIATNLQSWKVAPPLGQHFDKVESYFNKIKRELDALERTKDEESKRFQSHNIHFDFNILLQIKEYMVDVSSSCMELALQERREAKEAAEIGSKTEGKTKACPKILWKAFQLAFRVYSFAGGQDERADRLSRELAQEIENDPQHE